MTKAKELSELASATTVTSGNVALSGGLGVTGVVTANGGAVFNEGSADVDFRIETNGQANMLFVDGGANAVGIGVNDPDATLDISGGSNKLGILRVTQRAAGAAAYGLDVGLDSSTGDPVFSRIVNDTATEALRITRSSGLVTAANGLTLTDGNLTVASGHGIDFSVTGDGAGTDSSELLDDYEEGTWAPVLAGLNAGSSNGTYSVQVGTYTKVGRLINANFHIDIGSLNDGTGALTITGLPYASANIANNYGSMTVPHVSGWSGNYYNISGLVGANSSQMPIYYQAGNGNMVAATHAQLQEGNFLATIVYQTAS